MMDVDQMLFDLRVYSGSCLGYFLTRDAINLLIVCGEDWEPSLKALQEEVAKLRKCTNDTFQQEIKLVSCLAWERNRLLLEKYAYRELEAPPTASEFIDILIYVYFTKCVSVEGML